MNSKPKPDSREKSGVALVLILLLVGVVATLTINVQTSVVLVQRHMQTKRLRTELRASATDAAWCFLRDRIKPAAASAALPAPENAVLPSGVETSVIVTDSTGSFLGAIPFLGNKSISGKVYLLQASAASSNAVEEVSCIYRREKSGAIEVLGWDQNGA